MKRKRDALSHTGAIGATGQTGGIGEIGVIGVIGVIGGTDRIWLCEI